MIEQLIKKLGAPIKLLDVACGFGHELEFLKDDKRVLITGVDISKEVLSVAKENVPNGIFKVVDVSKNRPQANAFEAVIAVNAMIYCIDKMGVYAYDSLAGKGMATVNFRDAKRAENDPFFEDCIKKGCRDITEPLEVKGKHFSLRVMDYTQRKDINRNLGKQAYFQGRQDIENFLTLVGFEIVSRGTYTYKSSENKYNMTEVYTLKKG